MMVKSFSSKAAGAAVVVVQPGLGQLEAGRFGVVPPFEAERSPEAERSFEGAVWP
jgi:hypothetical protein